MTEHSTSSDAESNMPSVSFMSSNFDNLELARARAAVSIVNVNQYFLEITGDIRLCSDKASLFGDNSDDLNDEIHELGEKSDEKEEYENVRTFATELQGVEVEQESRDDFTMLPRSWILNAQYTLPNIRQIVDNQASDHYASGMIALKSAEWTVAIGHFTRCIHLKPNEASYFANRAEVFVQLTDFQSAILNYKRACILDLGNSQFFERLAFLYVFHSQILFDQCQYSSALEAIGRAIEMTPSNRSFHIRAIGCLAALNRHSECLALINKQLDDLDQPPNADFLVLRAKLHSNFRNFSLCYFDLIDALKIDPDHSEARSVLSRMCEQADSLRSSAVERALNNRLPEAINKLSLAIDLNPVNGDFHVQRGALYRRRGDFPAAIDDLIIAMDKVDHDEQHSVYRMAQRQLIIAFNDFAVACFAKGGFEEALTLLNRAIQSEKGEAAFYLNRGDCFFRLAQWDFALADYRQAATLAPDLTPLTANRAALVCFSKGQSAFNKGAFVEAERCFTEAIENNPMPALFWSVRARTRYLIEDFRGSRSDVICSVFISGYDKKLDSIFTRLFPGKSPSSVLESKFSKYCKQQLDKFMRSHPCFEGNASLNNSPSKVVVSDRKEPLGIKSCLSDEQVVAESFHRYHSLEDEIKRLCDDHSFIKRSGIAVKECPDFDSIIHGGRDICGIVGRSDGSTYVLNQKGFLRKAPVTQGWRKFKTGIT